MWIERADINGWRYFCYSILVTLSFTAIEKVMGLSQFELCLLGETTVVASGGEVQRIGPKTLAALAYLALMSKSQRRDLAMRLWPDSNDPLNNFAVARNAVLKQLGARLFVDDGDKVFLENVVCDVWQWRNFIQAGELLAAWGLWRGEFMQGFRLTDWDKGLGEEFEEWLQQQRELLLVERRELAVQIAKGHLRGNQFLEAIPFLEAACVAIDEPVEDAGRWLVLVFGALNNLDKASAVFQRLARQLRQELGVEPTQETQTAFALVRRADTAACRDALVRELGVEKPNNAFVGLEPRVDLPLFGRQKELQLLSDDLRLACQGQVRLSVLRGEPGVGKSRLAQELLHLATQNNCLVVQASASSGQAVPLAMFASVTEDVLRRHKSQSDVLSAGLRDALAQFFPNSVLGEAQNNVGSPEALRRSVFEAVRQLLIPKNQAAHHQTVSSQTVSSQTTVLLLDDVHLADLASLELALFLLRHPNPNGFLLLLCLRDTETPRADMNLLLKPQAREGLGTNIGLEPLDSIACAALAKALNRMDVNIEHLCQNTGGNALYAIESLLAEPGTASRRVQDLLRYRIEDLSELSRQILEAAAILGDGANAGLLRKTSGRSLEEVVLGLAELEAAGLMRQREQGASIHHDITREVVLSDLVISRASLLQLRAARARVNLPILAAEHFWQAKGVWEENDSEMALGAMLEAGTRVAIRGGLHDGLMWFERVLQTEKSADWQVKAWLCVAALHDAFAQYQEAVRALDKAELFASDVSGLTRARLFIQRSQVTNAVMGKTTEAKQYASRAIEELERINSFEANKLCIEAELQLGVAAHVERNFDATLLHFQSAVSKAILYGNERLLAEAQLGIGAAYRGYDFEKSIAAFDVAVEIWQRQNNIAKLARALHSAAGTCIEARQHQRADGYLQALLLLEPELGREYVSNNVWYLIGSGFFVKKEYGLAKEWYLKALHATIASGNLRLQNLCRFNLAEACLYLGETDTCIKVVAEGLDQFVQTEHPAWAANLLWLRAEALVVQNHLAEAEACYEAVRGFAKQVGFVGREAQAMARLARLKTDLGLAKKAAALHKALAIDASQQMLENHPLEALKTIRQLNDPYEEQRLLADMERQKSSRHSHPK